MEGMDTQDILSEQDLSNANIDDLLPWNEKVMEVCKYKK